MCVNLYVTLRLPACRALVVISACQLISQTSSRGSAPRLRPGQTMGMPPAGRYTCGQRQQPPQLLEGSLGIGSLGLLGCRDRAALCIHEGLENALSGNYNSKKRAIGVSL